MDSGATCHIADQMEVVLGDGHLLKAGKCGVVLR